MCDQKNMKKIYVTTLLLGLMSMSTFVNAQNSDSLTFVDVELRKNVTIYQLATQFNDPAVARMALYNVLIYTNNQSAVLDSMAMLYYNMNQMPSVALVTKENLMINPNNQTALELGGIAFNQLGAKDQALENYESLFNKNNDSRTLYQVAILQFELKRNIEAANSLDLLLTKTDIDGLKMGFDKLDKSRQEVSMRAAALNIKGMIAKANGDTPKAKATFLEALKAAPGFELAQLNLSKADK